MIITTSATYKNSYFKVGSMLVLGLRSVAIPAANGDEKVPFQISNGMYCNFELLRK